MNLIPVISSIISAVGYDNIENVLHIQFKGKKAIYRHRGVSFELYNSMMSADSIGSFYSKNIKK